MLAKSFGVSKPPTCLSGTHSRRLHWMWACGSASSPASCSVELPARREPAARLPARRAFQLGESESATLRRVGATGRKRARRERPVRRDGSGQNGKFLTPDCADGIRERERKFSEPDQKHADHRSPGLILVRLSHKDSACVSPKLLRIIALALNRRA